MIEKIPRTIGKVSFLLEACFDLISSPSPSMKIQIMGRNYWKSSDRIPTPVQKQDIKKWLESKILSLVGNICGSEHLNMIRKKNKFFWPSAHCNVLEHYYSVDFPWRFDRKIVSLAKMMMAKKKLVKWQKFKTALCNLTEKLLPSILSKCRPLWKSNAWLDLLEKNLYYSIFTLFHAGLVLFTMNGLNWPQSW